MNDLPPESRPVPLPGPDPNPTQALPADQSTALPDDHTSAPPPRQRLMDRLWTFRAVIAVALASVIIGGLGGAALANVSNRDDGRFGPGPGRFHRGGPGGPPGMTDGRQRGRMKQWHDQHGMGHRKWDQDGNPPSQPLTPLPSPTLPKSSG